MTALQDLSTGLLDQRKIIRNASLIIESDDPEAAYQEVTRIAEAAGGFVAEASVVTPTDAQAGTRVFMTVRLPATEMTATLEAIEKVGEVLDRTLGSQDVTEQYTDIEAQARNLGVLETELLALLRDVRQSTEAEPAELLTVFNQISDVRGQIEALQGQQRLLDDLIGLATVTVTIQQPPSEQPIVDEDGWNVGAVAQRALRTTVSALQAVGSGLVWLLLTGVPLILLGLVPAWLIWKVIVRRRTDGPGATSTGGGAERDVEATPGPVSSATEPPPPPHE